MSGKEYLVFIWADTVTSVRDIRPHLTQIVTGGGKGKITCFSLFVPEALQAPQQ